MSIPWDQIIEAVLAILDKCLEQNVSKETALAGLKSPRPVQRWRMERKVRLEMGISPREWRRQRQAIMAEVWAQHAAASNNDLTALVDEAAERRAA